MTLRQVSQLAGLFAIAFVLALVFGEIGAVVLALIVVPILVARILRNAFE